MNSSLQISRFHLNHIGVSRDELLISAQRLFSSGLNVYPSLATKTYIPLRDNDAMVQDSSGTFCKN